MGFLMYGSLLEIGQHLPHLPQLMIGENLIISSAYVAIGYGIAYGIWRNRHDGVDPVIVNVSILFWSCAFGHGMHCLGMVELPHALLWQVIADCLTVVAAIRFLCYYESFDVLARISQIANSKAQLEAKNQLLEDTISQLQQAQSQLVEKAELEAKNKQLQETLHTLQQTQSQLIHAEKMSSLGALVAGIAHEVNNPINFVAGNLNHIEAYSHDLLTLVDLYSINCTDVDPALTEAQQQIDLPFIQTDLPKLMSSMKMGTDRIREIVLSLRTFSRMDEAIYKAVNLHEGIDSTLMILQHRLKPQPNRAEIKVVKAYGDLPLVECYAGQLNQVFMNILANAIDVLDEMMQKPNQQAGEIHICTIVAAEWVKIIISDNGMGMPQAVAQKIFDPFFTTKPVGKGQGIGLSISYQIVVDKHHGKLDCHSQPNEGTKFIIQIPISQSPCNS